MATIVKTLGKYWRFFFLIAVPIILLPLIFIDGKDKDCVGTESECDAKEKKFKCAYVIVMMSAFWVTEAMPMAVTSLLPVLFFPLLSVQSTAEVTPNYMRETVMVFLGGLIIATAVEYCNLHKRIALRVMTVIGSSPIRLLLGSMITTSFLSMWLTNTATVAMMLPIVVAILDELHSKNPEPDLNTQSDGSHKFEIKPPVSESHENKDVNSDHKNGSSDSNLQMPEPEPEIDEGELNTRRMFLLATCYAANVGGTGTLIGSGTNLILQENIRNENVSQGGKYTDLTFATWMAYAIPGMLINCFVILMYLHFIFQILPRLRKKVGKTSDMNSASVGRMLRSKYEALGPMTFHEITVSVLFFIVVMLWLFRNPRFVEGWASSIPGVTVGDSTVSMLGVFLLFVIPKSFNEKFGRETLLDWKYAQSKLPWGILILIGAGFAISDAAARSGLSEWIAITLDGLDSLPPEAILIILMTTITFITEVASNPAVASVMIPIIISMSKRLNIHPLYLTVPTTLSTSFAFMLPVGNPPNAMVFSTGYLKTMDMVKTGLFLNLTCIIVVFLLHITYSTLIFDYNNYVYPNATSVPTF